MARRRHDDGLRETLPSPFFSDDDLFGDGPAPRRRAARKKPAAQVAPTPTGLTTGDFDYVHAYVCPNKHPHQPADTPGPVTCGVCGAAMKRHFFSKRRPSERGTP